MNISGFTYVRNGLELGYPFREAIRSILPLCDEVVVAVGDSTDGTREAVLDIAPGKVRVVDTVWDMKKKEGGKIFAMQANTALDEIRSDWAIHIQADECMHEKDHAAILSSIEKYHSDKKVDGFLQPFLHFWGTYDYVRDSRRVHQNEIRIFRNDKPIRSYRDSQGFRKYPNIEAYQNGEKGKKLEVVKLNVPVYHYNAVRPLDLMEKKDADFYSYWVGDQANRLKERKEFDYHQVDRLRRFTGTHPAVMKDLVAAMNWEFQYDPSKRHWRKKKDKYLQPIEDFLGIRFGEYKNYKLLKGK